jgi:hypothetical protein
METNEHSNLMHIIDIWWDRWHRFANETDLPPKYILDILSELAKEKINFDISTGQWSE